VTSLHRRRSLALLALVVGVSRVGPALAASCEFAVQRDAIVGNGARIAGDVQGLTVHLGRRVRLADGTTVGAARLELLNGATVFDAASPDIRMGPGVVIRGSRSAAPPSIDPCTTARPSCGGADVVVGRDAPPRMLGPGSYGNVVLDDGAVLTLSPGEYHFCSVRGGRHVIVGIENAAATTIEVLGDVRLDNGSTFGDVGGIAVVPLVAGGQRVKIGASGKLAAAVRAPSAALLVGRGAAMAGSACVARLSTGWNAALDCAETAASSTTTTVPTTTSTTTTSTTSTSTTIATTSTTSSTTTSTTSTTGGTSSSTSTTIVTTSSTTAPTTSSTTRSTTTSTTSTTASGGGVTCTGSGVDALITVPYGGSVAALGGVSIDLTYPASVSIPGNGFETEERSTDLTGSGGTLLSVDRDADHDGIDETLRLVYTLTGGRTFPPGDFASVFFDCVADMLIGPADLSCVVKSASDAAGNPVTPASVPCVVTSVTLHSP
jgi:hypothetical protein